MQDSNFQYKLVGLPTKCTRGHSNTDRVILCFKPGSYKSEKSPIISDKQSNFEAKQLPFT